MIITILSLILLLYSEDGSIVSKLQDKFLTINTLQADFSQSSNSAGSIKGEFLFKKENNYRITLRKNIIISDGTTIWNKDIERKKVVISNVAEDPLAFSLTDYILNYPSKCTIIEESLSSGYLIKLDSKDPDLNFESAELTISDEFIIQMIKVNDFAGNTFSFVFNNIQIDGLLSEELFK
jgi:outer membrane lipoprotein-sorting protein